MLALVHHLSGRPWAVRPEVAEYLRGTLLKQGVAGLRDLAAFRSALMFDEDDDDDRPRAAGRAPFVSGGATIAVVPIVGPVTQRGGFDFEACRGFRSTDAIAAEVRAAAAEPKIDAIVLEVDSPGGEVFGVPEAFTAIREATKSKPVIAAVNSVSASAAYYLSTAATEIWVNPSGQVGSIGVYALHVDVSKALEAMGEHSSFISAGKYKLEGNPLEPLADEARAEMQKQVDSYYEDFVRDVARGRGVGASKVRSGFGEGRMVRAKAAVAEKMADHVGTIDEAIGRAAALGKVRRRTATAAASAQGSPVTRYTDGKPTAGINDAPNLVEGTADRACGNCEYFSQPSADVASGQCSLYDFTTDRAWVCDAWEAAAEGAPEEAPAPDETPVAAPTLAQRLAVARLRTL